MKIDGKEAAEAICNSLNCMCGEEEFAEAYAERLMREHRTLQQAHGRLIAHIITKYAELPDNHCDARNEAWVKLCKKLAPIVKDSGLPFI